MYLDFCQLIPKLKNLTLPGRESQLKMVPEVSREARIDFENRAATARKAAVLSLFYPGYSGQVFFLLMLRKSYPGIHSNQVGFPGGKVESPDLSLMHTALRETEEETGIPIDFPEIIRPITEVFIPPSNFLVQPFMAHIPERPVFIPDPSEVEQLLEVPLKDLLDDRNEQWVTLDTSYATNIKVPCFWLHSHSVWGATAMMLSELKDLFKRVM